MKELQTYHHVHFIGIGGAGMSAIASVLLGRGFRVSGSDLVESGITRRLQRAGATIHFGHRSENFGAADLAVVSTAVRSDNPERLEAEARGKPVWHRARALAEIMRSGKSLAVTGTHGKTTTASMAAVALLDAGMEPTILIGGEVIALDGNARCGSGEWIVAEVDESDGSLLQIQPDRIILTNIEADHFDYFRDVDHVAEVFEAFVGRLRPGGKLIACLDSPPVQRLVRECAVPALTYALDNPEADLQARSIRYLSKGEVTRFTPVLHGEPLGSVRLRAPGRHNVANALGVLLAGMDLGLTFDDIAGSLARYEGTRRRFEIKGKSAGVTVIDDYAHHPTEIEVTLAAARSRLRAGKSERLIGVFQPHRYSRTAMLAAEFGRAFRQADMVIVSDIYPAGEEPLEGVSGRNIFDHVVSDGHRGAHYIPETEDIAEFLHSRLVSGDTLLTLGAGDVWRVGEDILKRLRSRAAQQSCDPVSSLGIAP